MARSAGRPRRSSLREPYAFLSSIICTSPSNSHHHSSGTPQAWSPSRSTWPTIPSPSGAPKRVIHNISDLERFGNGVSLRRELGYADSDVIVAFLGQMIRVKGLEMFIDVATRISDPRARFVVAGPLRNTEGAYTEARGQGAGGARSADPLPGLSDRRRKSLCDVGCDRHAIAVGRAVCDGSLRSCSGWEAGGGDKDRWHGGNPAGRGNGLSGRTPGPRRYDGVDRATDPGSRTSTSTWRGSSARARDSLAVEPVRQLEALYDSLTAP